jgi:inosine-uridine nucleoside N-ribohydrolase
MPSFVCAEQGATAVIVDTDVSLDDARALALLAASPAVSMRAVVTSDGGSTPCDGARRAAGLLAALGRDRPAVGVGKASTAKPPPWRPVTAALDAVLPGERGHCDAIPSAVEIARRAVAESADPVVWLALGPLTNLADLLRADPAAAGRIVRVDYAGGNALTGTTDWNTARDTEAARVVFGAGIPIRVLTPIGAAKALRIDDALLRRLAGTDTPAARFIARLHADEKVQSHLGRGPAPAVDDTAALALIRPSAFGESPVAGAQHVRKVESLSAEAAQAAWLEAAGAGTTAVPGAPERRTGLGGAR